ncbi:IS3 family transposase [Rhizobiaceae bacterium n13]|uniref:IS3 family transposase n=1 Tax=Ferirhizobium litorale TaxID=2927786 RepID=UPI0024B2943B|nr:IS3 family transposase [Fererhizobium litorale]MDI7865194.1 IS3 family transposase [Fererhizobium litorale]
MIDLPRSTFYYRSTTKAVHLTDAELIALIEDIQDELPCYGYRRVTHELHRRGHLVNHKRVARVMRANGLGIKPRKRYVRTTDSNHGSPVYPNLYRNLIPSRPDMVWVADFTYIRITAGFCYLAVILDACSRKVVGYALSKRIDTPLALAALRSALENRTPPPAVRNSEWTHIGQIQPVAATPQTRRCEWLRESENRSGQRGRNYPRQVGHLYGSVRTCVGSGEK